MCRSRSSASSAALYPSTGTPVQLYPQPSMTEQADTPQPVRYTNVDQILVRAASTEQIPAAIRQMTSLLHERHHIRPGQADDFNVRDMTEMTQALAATSQLMAGLLLCVALISLVVGGVGIMNIMLVSVTERTREIGLRMAVGARARDILRQFLTEAVVLCLLGGALGILLGVFGSWLVHVVLRWPIEPSLPAVVASVLCRRPSVWPSATTLPGRRRGWTRSKRCATSETAYGPASAAPQALRPGPRRAAPSPTAAATPGGSCTRGCAPPGRRRAC